MDTANATEGAPSQALVQALRRLLQPLVRLLLAHRITHRYFSELLKSVYVETARSELEREGRRQTDSGVSLLTGVHRKDVKRLREEADVDYTPPASVSLGARLVLRWTTDPRFLDATGRPLPLTRLPSPTAEPSLDELVEAVSKDIRARAVLDEWERLGVAEIRDDGRVHLVTEAFVPARGFDEKAHFFGRNLHDHMAAAAHNLGDEEPPMLERSVHYGQLSEKSVAELNALGEELGMETLQKLNRRAQALQRRDEAHTGSRHRVNIGMYLLRAKDDEDPT